MALSNQIISKFVKSTRDDTTKIKKESFVHGKLTDSGDGVIIDGSNIVTPVSITTNIDMSKPVTVMIKNHKAMVIGNVTPISDVSDNIEEVEDRKIINPTIRTSSLKVLRISDADIRALWDEE